MSNINLCFELRKRFFEGPVLDQARACGMILASFGSQAEDRPRVRFWLVTGFFDVACAPWISVMPEVSRHTVPLGASIAVDRKALDLRVRRLRPAAIEFDAGRVERLPYRYESFWAVRRTGSVIIGNAGAGALERALMSRRTIRRVTEELRLAS